MYCLTQTGQWELRVDFEFQNKTRSYLHYNVFKVGSATDEYPLTISGFTGITPTDPFATGGHNGQKFSTYDNDNDNDNDKQLCLCSSSIVCTFPFIVLLTTYVYASYICVNAMYQH